MELQTAKTIAILAKYMRDPSVLVDAGTTLADLEIDALDMPMICLDVEDAFNVQISYDDESEGFATVADLVACIEAGLTKLSQPRQRKVSRPKRGWMTA